MTLEDELMALGALTVAQVRRRPQDVSDAGPYDAMVRYTKPDGSITGVIGHGPDAETALDRVAELFRARVADGRVKRETHAGIA